MGQIKKVNVVEVGPRDGFQNIKVKVPTEVKIETIKLLLESGIQQMELTSFVNPKYIPQMYDSKEVAEYFTVHNPTGARFIALVPNDKGAENSLAAGVNTVSYVISASEMHNKNNVRRTVDESCDNLKQLAESHPDLNIRLDVATAFGCPFQGEVSLDEILKVTEAGVAAGIKEIVLCDTIGVANPNLVRMIAGEVKSRYNIPVALHLHDTRGMGLACTLAGLEAGIDTFEASVGGLGGCPFAPGAAGNTAMEDLLNMLNMMGIETGVDFDRYMVAVKYVRDHIQKNLTGRMINVCYNQN